VGARDGARALNYTPYAVSDQAVTPEGGVPRLADARTSSGPPASGSIFDFLADKGRALTFTDHGELIRTLATLAHAGKGPPNRRAPQRMVWRGVESARWSLSTTLDRAAYNRLARVSVEDLLPQHRALARTLGDELDLRNRPLLFGDLSTLSAARRAELLADLGLLIADADALLRTLARQHERRMLERLRTSRLYDAVPLLTNLELTALLQHHGACSRLLDVTLSPFIAAWFACAPSAEQHAPAPANADALILGFVVDASLDLAVRRGVDRADRDGPFYWRPRQQFITLTGRLVAQHGAFLVCPVAGGVQRWADGIGWCDGPGRAAVPLGHDFPDHCLAGTLPPLTVGDIVALRLHGEAIQRGLYSYLTDAHDLSISSVFPDVSGWVPLAERASRMWWDEPPFSWPPDAMRVDSRSGAEHG
jgi:hypothetical protein